MNERQRDLFLWLWSQRRKPGQVTIGLRGAAIGALGGVVFALILLGDAGIDDAAKLFLLSIGAFALIGWLGANRVYAAQEAQYQAILRTGARVPEQKPVMQPGDRGPAIAVAIAVAIIAGFIITLMTMYG